MKLWSRGLGTTEITMDFLNYVVKKDPESENVLIIGQMQDPVNWEFRITMGPEDIPGFIKMLFHVCVLKLGVFNAHRYISYLLKKEGHAAQDKDKLEEKVNAAYDQMMRRSRPGRPARPGRG
ncbi:MAG: hypothetical protein KKA60_07500 [Proteobacteria bacterium]|nr:hypothetical protein [Pseudomonadota bacterium]